MSLGLREQFFIMSSFDFSDLKHFICVQSLSIMDNFDMNKIEYGKYILQSFFNHALSIINHRVKVRILRSNVIE